VVEIEAKGEYTGSSYSWSGDETGTGNVKVDSVVFGKYISSSIWFGASPEPAKVTWEFEPAGNKTNLSWGFEANASYPMGRLFLNVMKGQLKKDFEKGLDNLAELMAEKDVKLSTTSEITKTDLEERRTMAAVTSGTMDEVTPQMEEMFNKVRKVVEEQGLQISGPPFAYYFDYDPETATTGLYCGVPVSALGEAGERVMPIVLEASPALMTLHKGPYDELSSSYNYLMEYVESNQVPVTWEAMEVYLTDPMTQPYSTLWETEIYFLTK
jgi:effector-binding domain-containing protein